MRLHNLLDAHVVQGVVPQACAFGGGGENATRSRIVARHRRPLERAALTVVDTSQMLGLVFVDYKGDGEQIYTCAEAQFLRQKNLETNKHMA